MASIPVPPKALDKALQHVRNGGMLLIPTYTHCTYIDAKCLDRWEKAGTPLLREDGNGYRMMTGRKSSVYILPGQLKFA